MSQRFPFARHWVDLGPPSSLNLCMEIDTEQLRPGLATFSTAIGWCGVVWRDDLLLGLQLPEATAILTRNRLARRFPNAIDRSPPPAVQTVIEEIKRLIEGHAEDLRAAALDLDGVPEFNRRVYALARAILPGRTRTYGDIATDLGDLALSRAVGKALGENPFPIVVPCHRVLGAGGKIGGFSANGGAATKARLLAIEGARTTDAPSLFDDASTFSIAPGRR